MPEQQMPEQQDVYKAILSYNDVITANDITVKYDGYLYNVTRNDEGGYGGLTRFPFSIINENDQNVVYTTTAGQHTIEISISESSIKTTECFKKAVKSVSVMMLTYEPEINMISGATWQEAYDALTNGTMVYLNDYLEILPCMSYNGGNIVFSLTYIIDAVYTDTYTWQQDGSVTHKSTSYPPQ